MVGGAVWCGDPGRLALGASPGLVARGRSTGWAQARLPVLWHPDTALHPGNSVWPLWASGPPGTGTV